MKVKVSNVMAKEIEKRTGYSASLVKFTPAEYSRFVTIYPEQEEKDYNEKTNMFSAIKVVYPDNYYAYPLYITTNELVTVFKNSDKTFEGFFEALKRTIEI